MAEKMAWKMPAMDETMDERHEATAIEQKGDVNIHPHLDVTSLAETYLP